MILITKPVSRFLYLQSGLQETASRGAQIAPFENAPSSNLATYPKQSKSSMRKTIAIVLGLKSIGIMIFILVVFFGIEKNH